jgi:adenine-specific DNA-methyltransferase
VELSGVLKDIDIAYLDPPYNQHPYGSNYFMLNLILKNKLDVEVSRVSGITQGWNRSVFNKSYSALDSMEKTISALQAKYAVISYNSEGFISFEEMTDMLKKYGKVKTVEIPYNTFRGSRNLRSRSIHVREYLFVLEK